MWVVLAVGTGLTRGAGPPPSRLGLRHRARPRRHVQAAAARLRALVAVGVPGQVDQRVGQQLGRRGPLGQARLRAQQLLARRRNQEAVALRVRHHLQRHPGAEQPRHLTGHHEQGRQALGVPGAGAHLPEGQGESAILPRDRLLGDMGNGNHANTFHRRTSPRSRLRASTPRSTSTRSTR